MLDTKYLIYGNKYKSFKQGILMFSTFIVPCFISIKYKDFNRWGSLRILFLALFFLASDILYILDINII